MQKWFHQPLKVVLQMNFRIRTAHLAKQYINTDAQIAKMDLNK